MKTVVIAILSALILGGCFMNDYSSITKDINRTDNLEKIEKLIKVGKINHFDRQDMTLLAWALFWNNEALLDKLLGAGANVNAEMKNNTLWNVALNIRVVKQRKTLDDEEDLSREYEPIYPNPMLIKKLIDHNLSVNVALKEGIRPLHLASSVYVLGGSEELIRLLLDGGADKNALDDKGQTAVAFAKTTIEAVRKEPEKFKYLDASRLDERLEKLKSLF